MLKPLLPLRSAIDTQITLDVVGNKIYQAARITYGVAGDPEDEKIPIDGFAVFHRRGDKVELFEVFLNPAPLDAGKARVAASRRT